MNPAVLVNMWQIPLQKIKEEGENSVNLNLVDTAINATHVVNWLGHKGCHIFAYKS